MKLNSYIDHTLLKADATKEQILKVCREAREYNFASVCVNASRVSLVKEQLEGSNVKVCVVVGFPLGATTKEVKAFETKHCIENGAQEVDMVINVGALKDKDYDLVKEDIKAVVDAADKKALVKVILETCLLTDEEIVKACELSKEAGADYVKTSTGFSTAGAKAEHIKLMRQTVGEIMGVKASGGVRTKEDAEAMINAGASRIGASSSVEMVEGKKAENSGY